MHQARYFTQKDQPGVMLPDKRHLADKHGTIHRLFNKKVSKKERARLKRQKGA